MDPIRIDPRRAVEEATKFNQKLAAGLKTLRSLDEVNYGATEREEIYREDKLVLYRFKGSSKPTSKVPLLIVYALVNRPYMVDLQDDRSLVKHLLALGEDVYIIDWGYPDQSDRYLTLDDYINGYIKRCVDVVAKRHKVEKINVLGICQGGTFSLCFASIYPETISTRKTTCFRTGRAAWMSIFLSTRSAMCPRI
jgi:polyhydroxyalkanoate synthase